MKVIRYVFNGNSKEMGWSEANEAVAMREADNGKYSIVDNGAEEIAEPSQLDRIEAQLAYTAMITGTLLEV